jgi:hypothetical protein
MVLVTGATGTNGRLVVQALRRAGQPVRAMVQDASRDADLQHLGAQLVAGDFDRPDNLDAALAGMQRCLLLSPVHRELVERERRFVERAKTADLEHLVKFSSSPANRDSTPCRAKARATSSRNCHESVKSRPALSRSLRQPIGQAREIHRPAWRPSRSPTQARAGRGRPRPIERARAARGCSVSRPRVLELLIGLPWSPRR